MAKFDKAARQELTNHIDAARDAHIEIAKQVGVLWQARLNMATASGDDAAVQSVMSEAAMQTYMDNCSCGGGGGTRFLD